MHYLYMSNYSEEFYKYLKKNYFFMSKFKNISSIKDRDMYMYNNIRNIFKGKIFTTYCAISDINLEYYLQLYYNKVNMDFILYLSQYRCRLQGRYLTSSTTDFPNFDSKYYNVKLEDIPKELNHYFSKIKTKPIPLNKSKLDRTIKEIEDKCIKHISIEKKKINTILSRFNLNNDCCNVIFSYIF